MPSWNDHDAPGYTAAAARERALRESPFTRLNELVNGVEVLPLTLLHFNRLHAIGSPFVTGREEFSAADIAIALWLLSPGYRPVRCIERRGHLRPTGWNHWRQLLYMRSQRHKCRGLAARATGLALYQFIQDSFYDAPKGGDNPNAVNYASWNAILCADFFPWTPAQIETIPVKILFQIRNERDYNERLQLWSDNKLSHKPVRTNPSEIFVVRHFEKLNQSRSSRREETPITPDSSAIAAN